MRFTKTLGMAGALVAAALVGGTLISAAFATDQPTTTDPATDAERGVYCDTFLDAFASELGATRDDVTAAGKSAALATIDAAVAAGDMTSERADRLRERISNADGDGCGLFRAAWARGFAHGAARGWVRGVLGGDVIEAAAEALDLSSADLLTQLRDSGSLQAVAEAQGADYDALKATVIAAVQADLDATNISDEHKAKVIEHVTTWLDNGGPAGGLRPGHPHRPGGTDNTGDADKGA